MKDLRSEIAEIISKECALSCPEDHEERDCDDCRADKILSKLREVVPAEKESTKYKQCITCGDRWINEEDRGWNSYRTKLLKILGGGKPSESEVER